MRRLNHRGFFVHVSIESIDRILCVDFFEDADGRFGFEQFRADPEDNGSWTPFGSFGRNRFESIEEATTRARMAMRWLSQDPKAASDLGLFVTSRAENTVE